MMEARPDLWFWYNYRNIIIETRKQLAKIFNAEEEGIILVENASTGVNR
jgi:hypothetical protein